MPLMAQIAQHLTRPRKIVRDETGRIMGVE